MGERRGDRGMATCSLSLGRRQGLEDLESPYGHSHQHWGSGWLKGRAMVSAHNTARRWDGSAPLTSLARLPGGSWSKNDRSRHTARMYLGRRSGSCNCMGSAEDSAEIGQRASRELRKTSRGSVAPLVDWRRDPMTHPDSAEQRHMATKRRESGADPTRSDMETTSQSEAPRDGKRGLPLGGLPALR
jgi:hypothetical protein